MQKKHGKGILAGLSIILLAYIIGAIAAWDFNPGQWQSEGRAFWTFLVFLVAIVVGLATSGVIKSD